MAEKTFGTKPAVSIGGQRLPTPFDDHITTVLVDQDLTAPAMCEVSIADPERTFLSSSNVELGAEITVTASPVANDDVEPIFAGIIHSIDAVYADDGQSVILVGFDESYPLTQNRLSRSYDDVTVGDVIGHLASDIGIQVGRTELGTTVHPTLSVFDETAWDFIARHAATVGCVIRFADKQLTVTKPAAAKEASEPGDFGAKQPDQLVPGHNVTSLWVHQTTARQAERIDVRGWDPVNKKHFTASKKAATTINEHDADPAEVGRDLGQAELIAPRPAIASQADCDLHANAMASAVASEHRFAEGEAIGSPALVAGSVVSIGEVEGLSGRYLLTHCRHRFDDQGYVTEFRCSGALDRSLLALVNAERARRLNGIYPAVVSDIADPEDLGRARLKLPWLADDFQTGWARVNQFGAGPEAGLTWLPEVDDEVVVGFIDGAPDAPVVLGTVFSRANPSPFRPLVDSSSGKVIRRGLRTRAGATLEMSDENGKEAIRMVSADGGLVLELDQNGKKLTLSSQGDIEIKAAGTLQLAGDGEVKVTGARINLN